jgi:RNA polymerase sigma-70 factor, ECF subfamily
MLLRYLNHLCGDREKANDLLQETFVKAYKGLPHTRSDLNLKAWLYKIATNTARSALRLAEWKRVVTFSEYEPQVQLSNLENTYAETELVLRTLAIIKPDYTTVLLLHWREGLSLDELCEILNLSKPNLKKRLYRAKQAFRATYAKEQSNQEDL